MNKKILLVIPIILSGLIIILNNKNIIIKESPSNINNDKLNIYLFWGEGCPNCEKEKEYLKTLNKKDVNIYSFEVWYNEKNYILMEKVASYFNEEVKGVPYTIIGDETFTGYSNTIKDKMNKKIKETKENDKEIYSKISRKNAT